MFQELIFLSFQKKLNKKEEKILVLALNFFDEIKKNNKDITDKFINLLDLAK